MENNAVSLKNVVVLYLIISANFLPNTFSCTLQRMLTETMYFKHIAGWLTLLYFVLIGSNTPTKDGSQFFKTMFQSAMLYLIYLFSTKLNSTFTYIFLSFCITYFLIQVYTESLDKTVFEDRVNQLVLTNTILTLLTMVILVVGVLVYCNERMHEYEDNFSLFTFIFGKTKCKSL